MIFIGERINAGFKEIKQAIADKNGDIIKATARKQADAGATYIDVNLGTASNKAEDLCWMIEMV
ncbi:methyltetrahydrofolate--corrinoid methyltransferase, partial [candidate division KSB3 bacterium]|nr:methyltetrahydrofolate--corrinoid methyltransferase [candidate division KSB3 bacterium]MBD3326614.1 methyltetrahydrofolate--corrinoid methyltransferase [candidate division KSB3 bacterium]